MHSVQRERTQKPANRLAALREAKGLMRSEIAGALRVDQSTVWRWEQGGAIPDARKVELANLLGVSVSDLMGWPDAPVDTSRAA